MCVHALYIKLLRTTITRNCRSQYRYDSRVQTFLFRKRIIFWTTNHPRIRNEHKNRNHLIRIKWTSKKNDEYLRYFFFGGFYIIRYYCDRA